MRLMGTNTEYHEKIGSCEASEGESSQIIKTAKEEDFERPMSL
jgi:hypothetical protein